MKKLSKISESIWSDIQDRSSGEITRKEDDVNNMDMESFWLYIIKNYKDKVMILDKSHYLKEYDMDIVVDPTNDVVIFGSYVKDELVNIRVILKTKVKDVTIKKIIDASPDNFRWIRIHNNNLELELNDGKVTNQTFVNLIEFFLNNQQVFESIWSDIQDRSAGDVVRDEDKFNPDYTDFGPNTTVYWAIDNLEIDGKVKFYFDDVKDYNNNGWRLPTIDEVNQLKWNIRISWYDECRHLEFDSGDELKLKTHGSGGFHMWTKEINPKFPSGAYAYGFDNSYNFDISNFNKSINKLFVFLVKDKKITESIWSDIQDRSSGETIRKEDEVGNLHELKPIDMGGSVLWADKNLICDGDELFTFHEAYELIKNSTWRLPTRKEVAELDGHNRYYDSNYIYLDDDRKLSFKKCGVEYIPKIGNPFTLDESKAFYGWTSEVTKYNSNDIHVFFLNHFELAYSPENERVFNQVTQNADSKCCVRLVKNK